MKVQIRDKEALESLTTTTLRTYLKLQGWTDVRRWGKRAEIHSKESSGRLWEVAIPLRDDCSDYAEFMAEAVTALAEAEDRSQLDVFYDLANPVAGTVLRDNQDGTGSVPNVWCVRAEKGQYTAHFVDSGYVAAGWLPKHALASDKDKEEIRRLFRKEHPEIVDNHSSGWHIGQIYSFLLKINVGDFVITPGSDSSQLWYGRVESKTYHVEKPSDPCPWPHRRKADWAEQPLDRNELAEPIQKSLMHTQLAIFEIRHREEFLAAVVRKLWPYARLHRRRSQ